MTKILTIDLVGTMYQTLVDDYEFVLKRSADDVDDYDDFRP